MENIQITQFLRDHHKTIRGLLAQAEASPVRARSREVGAEGELLDEIELHCLMAERTLYSALRNCEDSQLEGHVAECFHAHDELKQVVAVAHAFLKEARMLEVREQIETVRTLLDSHVGEEERELFPLAEKKLGTDQLVELTFKARAIREEFFRRPGVAARRPQRVKNLDSGEQMQKGV